MRFNNASDIKSDYKANSDTGAVGIPESSLVAKQRVKRDLKKISLFATLEQFTVKVVGDLVTERSQVTGITRDQLFNRNGNVINIDNINDNREQVRERLSLPYDLVFSRVQENVDSIVRGGEVPATLFRGNEYLKQFNEYKNHIKNFCEEGALMLALRNRDVTDGFHIVFLPWLEKIDFTDDGEIDETSTYSRILTENGQLENIFRLHLKLTTGQLNQIEINERLLALKFSIACVINDRDRANTYLNQVRDNVKQRFLSSVRWESIFEYNISRKFLDTIWNRVNELGQQQGWESLATLQSKILTGAFKSAAKNGHERIIDNLWSKAEMLQNPEGIQRNMLNAGRYEAFRLAAKNGYVVPVQRNGKEKKVDIRY